MRFIFIVYHIREEVNVCVFILIFRDCRKMYFCNSPLRFLYV